MARIIEKHYDAGKKIALSKFRGAPNLITTSDLNRQLEAFQHQLDLLASNTAVYSDFSIVLLRVGDVVTCVSGYTYMEFGGCSFSPATINGEIEVNKEAGMLYAVLTAKKKLVTYADDFEHTIAGAKFADGTSQPAAEQYVYYDEAVVISDTLDVDNKVVLLATLEKREGFGNYATRLNCLKKDSSLILEMLKTKDELISYISETKSELNGNIEKATVVKTYPISSYDLAEGTFVFPNGSLGDLAEGDFIELNIPFTTVLYSNGDEIAAGLVALRLECRVSTPNSVGGYSPLCVTTGTDDNIKLAGARALFDMATGTFTVDFTPHASFGSFIPSGYFKVTKLKTEQ